jgi:hypothetical protein
MSRVTPEEEGVPKIIVHEMGVKGSYFKDSLLQGSYMM